MSASYDKALVYTLLQELGGQDVEIDAPTLDELNAYVRLSRLGRFNEADEFFERRFRMYLDLFLVFAEYADSLLEKGEYGTLSTVLSTKLGEQSSLPQSPKQGFLLEEGTVAEDADTQKIHERMKEPRSTDEDTQLATAVSEEEADQFGPRLGVDEQYLLKSLLALCQVRTHGSLSDTLQSVRDAKRHIRGAGRHPYRAY